MLPIQFKKTLSLNKQYCDQVSGEVGNHDLTPEEDIKVEYLQNPKTNNYWEDDLGNSFSQEYKKLQRQGAYFLGCTTSLYQCTYPDRLQNFIKLNDEAEEQDFIEIELTNIVKYRIFAFAPEPLKKTIEWSLKKQKFFLEERLQMIGFRPIYDPMYAVDQYNSFIIKLERIEVKSPLEEVEDIKEGEYSRKEKVIALEELGILKLLYDNPSIGKNVTTISKLLSPIVGIKHKTLTSYINPIFNIHASQDNNPRTNKINVDRILYKLKGFGFKK